MELISRDPIVRRWLPCHKVLVLPSYRYLSPWVWLKAAAWNQQEYLLEERKRSVLQFDMSILSSVCFVRITVLHFWVVSCIGSPRRRKERDEWMKCSQSSQKSSMNCGHDVYWLGSKGSCSMIYSSRIRSCKLSCWLVLGRENTTEDCGRRKWQTTSTSLLLHKPLTGVANFFTIYTHTVSCKWLTLYFLLHAQYT